MGILNDYLPDWLPDDPSKNDAARQGLLAFGASLMQGHGNFGSILGSGLMAGSSGYHDALDNQQRNALTAAQLKQANLETQALQGKIDLPTNLAKVAAGVPGYGSISSGAPGSVQSVSSLPQIGQPRPQVAPAAAPMGGANFDMGYGSDSADSMPSIPQATAPRQPTQAPTTQPGGADPYTTQIMLAQAYQRAGYTEQAKDAFAAADRLKPKYATDFRQAVGADGKLHNYMLAEDGSVKEVALGVKPDMVSTDTGGKVVWSDKNALQPGTAMDKTVTPGEALQSQDQAKARAQQQAHWQAEQANSPDDAPMDPLAVRMTAQQYLAGDASALTNFGRGAQGAANLNAVRLEVAKQANAAGMNGADIAAKMAEFAGLKAGQRTAGTRSASIEIAANEVAQLAPIALEASAKVQRSGYLPFGKAQVMFNANTNDPAMRQFAMANTALVNAYGQAMARNGTATVSDKDHAREMLATAFDQPSYAAAVAQLQTETRAAQAAPKQVRKDLSDAVSGREVKPAPVAKVAELPKKAAPAAAAHPADINDLLKKYGGK